MGNNINDLKFVAQVLRADFLECLEKGEGERHPIRLLLNKFQKYCSRERPEKYKSFVEYARSVAVYTNFYLDNDDYVARKTIGQKCADAKRGYAKDFLVTMIAFIQEFMPEDYQILTHSFRVTNTDYYDTKAPHQKTQGPIYQRLSSLNSDQLECHEKASLRDLEVSIKSHENKPEESFWLSNVPLSQIPSRVLNLNHIKKFYITGTYIEHIDGLSNFDDLEVFTCTFTPLKTLRGLPVSKLEEITLAWCDFTDISILSSAKCLTRFHVESDRFCNLEPLSACSRLEWVWLSSPRIDSLEAFKECADVKYINFSATDVRDISPLHHLKNLKAVIPNNHCAGDVAKLGLNR